jgi:phage shock protein A
MSTPTIPPAASESNGASVSSLLQQVQAKHDELEQTVRALQKKITELEAERERLGHTSETYRRSLQHLIRTGSPEPAVDWTKADLEAMEASSLTFDDVLRELKAG